MKSPVVHLATVDVSAGEKKEKEKKEKTSASEKTMNQIICFQFFLIVEKIRLGASTQ